MDEPEFLYQERLDKSITRITFNRPEKLNALNFQMYQELDDLVSAAEDDDEIKVIILRGAGAAYGSGQDLEQVGFVYGMGTTKDAPRPSIRRRLAVDRRWSDHFRRFWECSKLTVSQIHGHCLGAHFDFAMMSNFCVAAEDANLGHPGLRLVGPGLNFNIAAWYWDIPHRLADEMMFLGRTLSGTEAARYGVVNRAVPEAQLEAEVLSLADQLSLMPADGIVLAKQAIMVVREGMGIRAGFTYGAVSHTMNTMAKFGPDEFNFFRQRREHGAKAAFHERDARYRSDSTEPTQASAEAGES
jgi:enoyl-CoA hydratase